MTEVTAAAKLSRLNVLLHTMTPEVDLLGRLIVRLNPEGWRELRAVVNSQAELLAALEDEREWLLDQIDGATECRGRDSAISARIQAIGIAIRKAGGQA